jgi:hypothetical protein
MPAMKELLLFVENKISFLKKNCKTIIADFSADPVNLSTLDKLLPKKLGINAIENRYSSPHRP